MNREAPWIQGEVRPNVRPFVSRTLSAAAYVGVGTVGFGLAYSCFLLAGNVAPDPHVIFCAIPGTLAATAGGIMIRHSHRRHDR